MRTTKPAYNKPGRPTNVQTGGGFPLAEKPNSKPFIPPRGRNSMGAMPRQMDKKAMKMDSIQRRLTGG